MIDQRGLKRILDEVAGGTPASAKESDQLDFKQDKPSDKETWVDLAEAVVCMANAAGGLIVVGVRDKPGGPGAIVGTRLDAAILRRRIYELTMPKLLVDVHPLDWADHQLLVVTVPEGVLDAYSTSKGYTYRRFGTDCLPMTADEVARLSDERRGLDWSASSSGYSRSAVTPRAWEVLRQYLATSVKSGSRALAGAPDDDVLSALRLVASDGELTRAGALLLCREVELSGQEVLAYQHRHSSGGEADTVIRWGTPVLVAFEEAETAIRLRQGFTPLQLSSGVQLKLEDVPSAVVREALVNALAHGDYRSRRPTWIEHSPQALVVTSPGPLLAGITPDNILTHAPAPRFPALARVFRALDLAEDVGLGVDRMFRDMIRNGRHLPIITTDEFQVAVTLLGGAPEKGLAQFVAGLARPLQEDTDILIILYILCRRRVVTAESIAPAIQRPMERAAEILRELATGGALLIEPTRGTVGRRHPSYRLTSDALIQLGSAAEYQRANTQTSDAKVINHVREYGWINNSTVQRMFDLNVYRARDLLRDLVDRQVLVRTSEASRGAAVRYGPGPGFPPRPGGRS